MSKHCTEIGVGQEAFLKKINEVHNDPGVCYQFVFK